MQDMNSHGRAQPHSAKSINLEANILSEWAASSTVMLQQLKLRLITLVAVIAASTIVIPSLKVVAATASAKVAVARARNSKDAEALAAMDQKSKAAQPVVQEEQRLNESRSNLQALLGNLALVINAVPTTVAFDSVQAEVMDAQLTITCKSQAETETAGQTFVDLASKGPNVAYAVQASTMKSVVLGKDGVAFDFIKRVNLEP